MAGNKIDGLFCPINLKATIPNDNLPLTGLYTTSFTAYSMPAYVDATTPKYDLFPATNDDTSTTDDTNHVFIYNYPSTAVWTNPGSANWATAGNDVDICTTWWILDFPRVACVEW